MIRDVDLIPYLPQCMAVLKEISQALQAENPEFKLVWEAVDRALYNEFIATADDYGLSRFENMLKILPPQEDTLDERRIVVQARWDNATPYTLHALKLRLDNLCGTGGYEMTLFPDEYRLKIQLRLAVKKLLEEVPLLTDRMVPGNIRLEVSLRYNRWQDVKPLTWGQAALHTWGQIREEDFS